MNKTEKQEFISSLNNVFSSASLVVVTRQSGMTVGESAELRSRMRKAGAHYKVIKNTLTRIALKDTPFENITEMFTGPVAIAYSDDPVAAAKVAVEFSKDVNKLEVVGGGLQGQALSGEGVTQLAKLPSLDELRGKIIGVISAPASKVARTVQAPAAQLARVFGAYGAKESN